MDKYEKHIVDLKADMKYLIKVVEGNGDMGLIKKVSQNTAFKNKALGGFVVLSAIGIGNIILTLTK